MLKVNELFKSIQGEGAQTGWPAIFVRFAGCNLNCVFCDTDNELDFTITVEDLLSKIYTLCEKQRYLIVLTGGEPLIQPEKDLRELCSGLIHNGFQIQIETNGTINNDILLYCKYITCSPKQPFESLKINIEQVTCWKMLYPSNFNLMPYRELANTTPKRSERVSFYLQPKDVSHIDFKTQYYLKATIETIKGWGLPWKLSLQTQKYINER